MDYTSPANRSLINEKQARYFDEAVNIFDQEQPPHIQRALEHIVASASLREGETVLDVGAGVGVLVPFLRAHGAGLIIACELSTKMLERLKEKHPNVMTILSDVCDLTLPDASVDAIFMNAVFPNIADKSKALDNVARMLRVGGRLIISHPEGREFVDRLHEVLPFPLDSLPNFPHLRRLLQGLHLRIDRYVDRQDLYLAVMKKPC